MYIQFKIQLPQFQEMFFNLSKFWIEDISWKSFKIYIFIRGKVYFCNNVNPVNKYLFKVNNEQCWWMFYFNVFTVDFQKVFTLGKVV